MFNSRFFDAKNEQCLNIYEMTMKTLPRKENGTMSYVLKRNSISKEPVKIRFRKLACGSHSIYLTINVNGRRTYDYLRLYLVPEIDDAAREQNRNTMEAVYAIKAQRMIQIINGYAGIRKDTRSKMFLVDWLRLYSEHQTRRGRHSAARWVNTIIYALGKYDKGKPATLAAIDRNWLTEFMLFLMNDYTTYKNTRPAKGTVDNYLRCLKAAFNVAVTEGVLPSNPMTGIDRSHLKDSTNIREYLTVCEVKKLISTPCRRPMLKNAFLFACFCGLRISDIRRLKWKNLTHDGDKTYIRITQLKTGRALLLPLNKQAINRLPARGRDKDEDIIFRPLPRNMTALATWAKEAGINKHVTFHVSRHTFATMELTLGADIYTTSKLLGHTEVRTTQIYARIVNSKKEEAVSLLDSAFE